MEDCLNIFDGNGEPILHAEQSRLCQINTRDFNDPDNCIDSQLIQTVVNELLTETLFNEKYEPDKCKQLSEQLARDALERISSVHSTLANKHFKHVVIVSIGSVNSHLSSESSGTVYFGSRCLWNRLTDFFTKAQFNNSSLYAIALIFSLRCDNRDAVGSRPPVDRQ
jgi:hypothetical protein